VQFILEKQDSFILEVPTKIDLRTSIAATKQVSIVS